LSSNPSNKIDSAVFKKLLCESPFLLGLSLFELQKSLNSGCLVT
jgi:hypothetical protein